MIMGISGLFVSQDTGTDTDHGNGGNEEAGRGDTTGGGTGEDGGGDDAENVPLPRWLYYSLRLLTL